MRLLRYFCFFIVFVLSTKIALFWFHFIKGTSKTFLSTVYLGNVLSVPYSLIIINEKLADVLD